MKQAILLFTFLLSTILVDGQTIYTKTFGDKNNKPIIFLHGGPGYNSVTFEETTAQKLADKNFFVIVYDRRGEGRSIDPNAKFNFQEAFDDLNDIYKKFQLKKVTLIGHSFGGEIATLYAEKYPKNIKNIILVSSLISPQETFKTILTSSKAIYQIKKDSVNLKYISMLENMDTSSIEYSGYLFMHAMQNGFYSTKNPNDLAKTIYSTFKTNSLLSKYTSQMNYKAPQGFWKNENYTTLDITEKIKKLKTRKLELFALYGKEDGLFSVNQVSKLQIIIGKDNLKYLDNCSHNVFIDQQTEFIDKIIEWTK